METQSESTQAQNNEVAEAPSPLIEQVLYGEEAPLTPRVSAEPWTPRVAAEPELIEDELARDLEEIIGDSIVNPSCLHSPSRVTEKQPKVPQDPGSIEFLRVKYAHMIPKRPLNAYFFFLKDADQRSKAEEALRAEDNPVSTIALGKKLGQMWQTLEEESRAVFRERVAVATSAYAEKLEAWKATPECAEVESAKQRRGKRKRALPADIPEAGNGSCPTDLQLSQSTPTKQRRPRPRPRRTITTLDVDPDVLEEARDSSLESQLIALAGSAEVQALGISIRTAAGAKLLLNALKGLGAAKESVEAARDAILAGRSS